MVKATDVALVTTTRRILRLSGAVNLVVGTFRTSVVAFTIIHKGENKTTTPYFIYILVNTHSRFTGENLERNKCFYERTNDLASKHARTPSRLALAWLLHQGNYIIPISGTTKMKNFENNIGSLNVKLTEQQLKEISDAVPVEEIAGKRDYGSLSQYMWEFSTTPPLK
ncbi:hypothetical protein RYX36_020919 [Vicia faba]